jgi:glycosyltransferase involved in cell wall biosynthesis
LQGQTLAILMGTYNGAKYLRAQLDSIEAQTFKNWRLIVSDDGSTDQTIEILEEYQCRWGVDKLEVRHGPQEGFSKNFMTMACDTTLQADFYAFADQDDVWLPEKLEVALSYFKNEKSILDPALYCGRTAYVRDDLAPYEKSPLFVYPRSFRNALVQSIAGGNTMIFNRAAKVLLERAGVVDPVSHDWWIYQIVSGAEGYVFYDPTPYVLYRQHDAALVGGNTSFTARARRILMVVHGRFKDWNDANVQSLFKARHCLSQSSIEILELFATLRHSNSLVQRLRMLEVCGLYRQTWRGTMSLILAAALKKI